MQRIASVLFGLLFHIPAIYAQTVPCDENRFNDKFLQQIEGEWLGSGQIGGDAVSYTIHAKWELNHQFFHISLSDVAINPQYAAEIYIGYDCKKGQYIAHWIDPFGGLFSETLGYGKAAATGIDFVFTYPNGLFANHFIIQSDSIWEMKTESQNSKGDWVEFGDVLMTRK